MPNKNSTESPVLFQQHAFQNHDKEYHVDQNQSTNIQNTILNKLDTAQVVGTFQATSPGKRELTALFTYNEGKEVPVTVNITVIQVQLTAKIITPLPDKVVKNSAHPVEFLIQNKNEADAIISGFNPGPLLKDSIFIHEESIDGNTPVITYTYKEFQEKLKEGLTLDPNKQYRVKAIYKVNEKEIKKDVLFQYEESATLENPLDQEGVRPPLLENVIIDGKANVTIIGKASFENLKLKISSEEKIKFTFTNIDPNYPATGIDITIRQKIKGQEAIVKKN